MSDKLTTHRIFGGDVGKQADHPAAVIMDGRIVGPRTVEHAAEAKTGIDYDDLAEHWAQLADLCDLTLIDSGGPGWPVIDAMRKRSKAQIWAVAITAGHNIRFLEQQRAVFIPKKALIGDVKLRMEKDLIKFGAVAGMPGGEKLTSQLGDFVEKQTPGGGVKLEAAGTGHDDLLMAFCLANVGYDLLNLLHNRRAA